MKDEILAAVLFLVRFMEKNEKFPRDKLDMFKVQLTDLLTERFKNHWFPDCPTKGQGYRCIRVNELHPVDFVLQKAAASAGLSYNDLQLPIELTLWVDPSEVCCRFGESEGSYCTLATFPDKENPLDISDQLDLSTSSTLNSSTESLIGNTKSLVSCNVAVSGTEGKRNIQKKYRIKNISPIGSGNFYILNKQANSNANGNHMTHGNRHGQLVTSNAHWRNNYYEPLQHFNLNNGGSYSSAYNYRPSYGRTSQFHNVLTA